MKKEIERNIKVGITTAKINLLFIPLYLLLQILAYLFFQNSLTQNGFWVIFIPLFSLLILAFLYTLLKRNNVNYKAYYIFHMSMMGLLFTLIGAIVVIFIYFIGQCSAYSTSFGTECIQGILNGSLKQKYWHSNQ